MKTFGHAIYGQPVHRFIIDCIEKCPSKDDVHVIVDYAQLLLDDLSNVSNPPRVEIMMIFLFSEGLSETLEIVEQRIVASSARQIYKKVRAEDGTIFIDVA